MTGGGGQQPPPSVRNAGKRTLSGMSWGLSADLVTVVVQVGHAAVMARLLIPADFGLVALAMAFLRFGAFMSQLGLGHALVQKEALSDRAVRTAFTTSVVLGLGLSILFSQLAVFVDGVTETPEAVPVTQALAWLMFVSALGTTSRSLLKRALRFRTQAMISVGTYVVGYVVVGISLAAAGFGVWSLVFAALAQTALGSATVMLIVRHSLRPLVDLHELRALYGYGARFSALQLLAAVQHAVILGVIGRFAGATAVGLYDRAHLLVVLPFEKVQASATGVLFPIISRSQSDVARLRTAYLGHSALVTAVALPTLAGMGASAGPLVAVLLGDQWNLVPAIVPIVAVGVAFGLLAHMARVVCDGLALLGPRLRIDAAQLLLTAAILFLVRDTGVAGMAAAVAAGQAFQYALYTRLLLRRLEIDPISYVRTIAPGTVAALLVALVLAGVLRLGSHVGFDAAGPSLALQMVLGAITLIALLRSPLFASQRSTLGRRLLAALGTGTSSRVARRLIVFTFGIAETDQSGVSEL